LTFQRDSRLLASSKSKFSPPSKKKLQLLQATTASRQTRGLKGLTESRNIAGNCSNLRNSLIPSTPLYQQCKERKMCSYCLLFAFTHQNDNTAISFATCSSHTLYKSYRGTGRIETHDQVNIPDIKTFFTNRCRHHSIITTSSKPSQNL